MKKLTEKEYWNSVYNESINKESSLKQKYLIRKLKLLVKSFLPKKILSCMLDYYPEYLLWNKILKKYIVKKNGLKVVEIGSAPGNTLVKFHEIFNCSPYGVEYSEEGAELNKRLFLFHNLDPNNIIHQDFFSNELHKEYREYFDIVSSFGFIEHFSNVKDVIDKHVNLLAKGGILVVAIPNYKGINYLLANFFNKKNIKRHNLEIMDLKMFHNVFNINNLTTLFCDYYGTFTFNLFNTSKKSSFKYVILEIFNYSQLILNLVFLFLFKDKRAESKFFSPHLIFIGKKINTNRLLNAF